MSEQEAIALFDMDEVKMDSPRLIQLKQHDIQTHHAPHCEEPWMAIPMIKAKEIAKAYLDGDEDDIASMTASAGRLLEDAGLVFYGHSQRDVEDAALAHMNAKGHTSEPCNQKNTKQ